MKKFELVVLSMGGVELSKETFDSFREAKEVGLYSVTDSTSIAIQRVDDDFRLYVYKCIHCGSIEFNDSYGAYCDECESLYFSKQRKQDEENDEKYFKVLEELVEIYNEIKIKEEA